jgi:hypothetical protein
MKKSICLVGLLCAFAMAVCPSFQATAQTVRHVTLNAFPGTKSIAVQSNQLISPAGYDWFKNPSLSGTMADGSP